MKKNLEGYCLWHTKRGTPQIGQPWSNSKGEIWILKTYEEAYKISAETDTWGQICRVKGCVNYSERGDRYYTNEAYNLTVTKIIDPQIPEISEQNVINMGTKIASRLPKLNWALYDEISHCAKN